MQKYMKELKQTVFRFDCHECVIPSGPIAYIEFCKKKNGEEEIIYDLDACEELLKIPWDYRLSRTGNAFVSKN
jgi:DNA polymerase-3 subunit alpha